ncbi:NAD(P)-binding protein [Hypoxylon sp. FL1284]|nr:NAD(P)-binding protein [Hypoxylon sp. FL1284]
MASAKGSIFVTGANGGLGSAIVAHVLSHPSLAQNYHGVYAVRKVESANDLKKVLRGADKAKHQHDLVSLDLSSLESVRKVAADINARVASSQIPPLRALVLSAAYQEHFDQNFTQDGFDMTFQATYLSHFLLTLLLLQSLDKEEGRVVVVGSWTHDPLDPRNNLGPFGEAFAPQEFHQIFTDPEGSTEPVAKGKWGAAAGRTDDPLAGFRRYGASKLSEVMMMLELAQRVSKDPALSKISVLGLDPGGMQSSLARRGPWVVRVLILQIIMPLFAPLATWLNPNGDLRTTSKSAADTIHASFDTDGGLGEHPNGLYLNGSLVSETGAEAKDETKRRRLWSESLGYAGIKEGDTVLADWR